eukprot:CAMPEP_0115368720 /NCGR_PEP_ID=MMETSP0270-20121206/105960_1 /TAXON_ID=71861 /ORGANISM="Scrippsiella trochoidea, Strain CCMP3099" /LENGTH=128 /DNA_ID=CAMNT_0002791519 /DNA_START=170 /DNA_END=553 /DNA_ORIENTATION=+
MTTTRANAFRAFTRDITSHTKYAKVPNHAKLLTANNAFRRPAGLLVSHKSINALLHISNQFNVANTATPWRRVEALANSRAAIKDGPNEKTSKPQSCPQGSTTQGTTDKKSTTNEATRQTLLRQRRRK